MFTYMVAECRARGQINVDVHKLPMRTQFSDVLLGREGKKIGSSLRVHEFADLVRMMTSAMSRTSRVIE